MQLGLWLGAVGVLIAVLKYWHSRVSMRVPSIEKARWSIPTILLLAGLLAASSPAFELNAVAATPSTAPKVVPNNPQTFVATTANRQPAGGPPPKAAVAAARSASANKREVPSRRTRNSKTYKETTGYVTEIFPGAINYQNATGDWVPIDNTLVGTRAAGFAYRNKANSFSVYLPNSAGTVRFATASGSVDFSLIGATGKGSVRADTATYRNVLPGVDLAYSALNEGLKENLTLANLASPHSFSYDLQTSVGLLARANLNHGIDFVDNRGMVQFSFSQPFMYESGAPNESTGSAAIRLTGTSGHQIVTLSLDEAWLSNPARHWPVVVDPTITYGTVGSAIWKQFNGANQDCYLQSGSGASTSFCNGSSLYAGYSGGVIDRSLLQFNVQNSIPQDVTVLDADLAVYLYGSASGSPVSVDAMQLTQAWSTGATWNTYNGTNAWTNAGGTFASPSAWTDASVGTGAGYYHWYLANLVQNWVYGNVPNDGILLKATNETTTDLLSFRSSEYSNSAYWPYLRVTYQLGIGDKPADQSVTQKLTDRLNLQVDLSSGNLLVKHHEQAIRGTGLDQNVDLFYNNLSPAVWDYGRSWEISTGWDVWLATNHPDGINYYGPSGVAVHFIKKPDGTFTAPPGLDATLVRNGDLTYTLSFNASQEKYNFSTDGLSLLSDVDRNGNRISFAYNASGSLASMTDTQGRVTTFGYVAAPAGCTAPTTSGFVNSMTDPAGRKYQYAYDPNCNLTTLTDAANKVTRFGYDASFNLTQITDPIGNVTKLGYDSATRLTSIVRVTNVALGTGPTSTYAYNTGIGSCAAAPPGDSVYGYNLATDPNSHTTTYCYDQQGLILQVVDPNGDSVKAAYSPDQHLSASTDALSQTTSGTYNTNNDLTQITPPTLGSGQSAAATSTTFQAPSTIAGYQYLVSSMTDTQGHCAAFVYDAAGNETDIYSGQTSPCDGHTAGTHVSSRYQGDPGVNCGGKPGELCNTTDALGNISTNGYDTNGNLTLVTPPTPQAPTSIAVDSLSRVSSTTDGKGQKTSYSYDALDRVTQILYNGAQTCTPSTGNCITYAFDGAGNELNTVDNTGTTTFYRDALNRVTTESLPDATSICPGSSPAGITLSYDGSSNLTQYCDAGGATSYGYNATNQLVSIAEPGGNCGSTPALCTTFIYNANGQRTQATFPGGATLNAAYDGNSNPTSVQGKDKNAAILTSFSYTYNNGTADTRLRQTMTENDPVANNTYTYGYDAVNRLAQATVTAGTGTSYAYGYDAIGNLVTKVAGSATTSYAYNADKELCWAYSGSSSNSCSSPPTGATTYTFDPNGNQTGSSAGDSFTYNSKNQATAMTSAGTTLSPITYSGVGQAQRTMAGTSTFNSSLSGLQISTTSGSSTFYLRDNQGNLVGERIGGNHYYYLTDALGSIVAVVSGDGLTVGDRYAYDPYGSTTYHSGTVPNPWGYGGGFADSTGMIKFGTRYYSPTRGQFTQTDPAGQSPSPYQYANDNPVNFGDPSGDLSVSCGGWKSWRSGWGWWSFDFYGSCWFDVSQFDIWYWSSTLGFIIGMAAGPIGPAAGFLISLALGWLFGQISTYYFPNGFYFGIWARGHSSWSWPWNWNNWLNWGFWGGRNSYCIVDWACYP